MNMPDKETTHEVREYIIGLCRICVCDATRSLKTYFPDGTSLEAGANDDDDSQKWALDLGYSNTWDMSREHEILHTWLALKQGMKFSPTLWSVANRGKEGCLKRVDQGQEEWLICCFQRWMNLGEYHPVLDRLTDLGFNLDTLKREFLEFLDA
jgi:hypothetical protein